MHGEYNDVASDMKSKDATIEHIMPQTLNAEWREMLGDNFEKIQERYLHTFANLTLTGINSELSNKAFEIKRDGRTVDNIVYPGYKDSKYRLTRSVTDCQKWTEEELQKRSKEICEAFLRLYPLPKQISSHCQNLLKKYLWTKNLSLQQIEYLEDSVCLDMSITNRYGKICL